MSVTEYRPQGRSGPIAGPGVGRHLLIVDDDDASANCSRNIWRAKAIA
jgi:hypothetical protein